VSVVERKFYGTLNILNVGTTYGPSFKWQVFQRCWTRYRDDWHSDVSNL